MKITLAAIALSAAAVGWGGAAAANEGQQQACAGAIAKKADVPMSAVRVVPGSGKGSQAGINDIQFEFPGGSAECWVDKNFRIHDVHIATYHGKSEDADRTGQKEACASFFADKLGVPMSAVRTHHARPTSHGKLLVAVSAGNKTGECEVDTKFNIVAFNRT